MRAPVYAGQGLKLLPGVVRERASVTGFVKLTKPKVTAPASHNGGIKS